MPKGVYIRTKEHNKKIAQSRIGENNPHWVGNNVGLVGLHLWIRKHLIKPDLCEICYLVPPRDLSNKTGIYNRDFNNWQYLCRKCHMNYDGWGKNLELGRGKYWPRKDTKQLEVFQHL